MVVIFVVPRKKKWFIFDDIWDDTNPLADNFTNEHLKKQKNNIDDAQGAVVNPTYAPGGDPTTTIW